MADSKDYIEFPCTTFRQGKYELVLFTADAKALNSVVVANQREEDDGDGYQRIISPSRQKKIARFIDSGKPLPLSILIAFDKAELVNNKKMIRIPKKKTAGWIIDGQHRLAGAKDAETNLTLPVIAFIGLDLEAQIEQFVTINKEQTGVPSSLYYELLPHLPKVKSDKELAEERAAELATALKKDEDSPFFGRIVATSSPRKGQISLTQFVRKVAPYLRRDSGWLYMYRDDDRVRILNNYYTAIAAAYPKEYNRSDSIFFQTLGFGALMNALPSFWGACVKYRQGFRSIDIRYLLKKMPELDPSAWHQMGTGSAAEKRAGEDIIELLRNLQDDDVLQSKGIRLS